jgi:hypothetical protein
MSNQITATQIAADKTVHVRGKLTYSRLAKLIEGDELAQVDARRTKNGMSPVGRAHTTANLAHAEVVFADAANPSLEEKFVQERRYTSAKKPEQGLSYSIDNKSPNLPIVGVLNDAGQVEQVVLTGDLAAGLDVTLVLRTYKPANYAQHGLAIDLVIVHEPIRYYNTAVNTSELSARGIVFATPPRVVTGAEAAASGATSATEEYEQAETAVLPANTDLSTGLPSAPGAAAPAAPAQAQAPTPAPVQAQAPAAASVESQDEEIARLRATLAARDNAEAASGGESAFETPWENTPEGVAAAKGIAFSG